MLITRKSPFTGKANELDLPITEKQLKTWYEGELIQNAMPNLTPDQREFLISGVTAKEWDKYIGNGEDEDDGYIPDKDDEPW